MKDFIPLRVSCCYFCVSGTVSSEFMHGSCRLSPSASARVVAAQREISWEQPLTLHSCSCPPQGMMMRPSAPPSGAPIAGWCCPQYQHGLSSVGSSYLETKALPLAGLAQHPMRRVPLASACSRSPIQACGAWPADKDLEEDCIILSYLRYLSQPLFSSYGQNSASK